MHIDVKEEAETKPKANWQLECAVLMLLNTYRFVVGQADSHHNTAIPKRSIHGICRTFHFSIFVFPFSCLYSKTKVKEIICYNRNQFIYNFVRHPLRAFFNHLTLIQKHHSYSMYIDSLNRNDIYHLHPFVRSQMNSMSHFKIIQFA